MNAPQSPDDDLDQLRPFWLEAGKDLVRNSPKTLDETARQIIAVSGILEGLYFHAITYSDLPGQALPSSAQIVYLLPILLFLFSLAGALFVFFPAKYEFELRSWEAARIIHQRTLRNKLWLVRVSSIFLILGIVSLVWAVMQYLQG